MSARKPPQKAMTTQARLPQLKAATAARYGPPLNTPLWAPTATAGTLTVAPGSGATPQIPARGGSTARCLSARRRATKVELKKNS